MSLASFLKKLSVPFFTGGFMIAGTSALGLCTVYTDAAIIALVGGGFLARELIGYAKYNGKEKLNGKTVVITGCNTGIGFETAKDLAQRGARIIMACRDMERCEAAASKIKDIVNSNNVICKKLDLSSFESIRAFCDEFNRTEARLDILINNAGVMMCPRMLTKDGLEMQLGTNHFGHFLLTNLLLDKLKASRPSRIVAVSSRAHTRTQGINFDDINSEKSYEKMTAYSQSKLANILHVKELTRRLEGTGVTAYALHPGVVATELPRHIALANNPIILFLTAPLRYILLKTPLEGAQTTLACALNPAWETISGKYYSDCKEKEPSLPAQDAEAAKRLWDVSVEITEGKRTFKTSA
ncbi:hypothetical protein EGW08_019457 [Elysia chlorotica]|uniref:Uncharacterized protein n=1 Tax=Elysia chlorotica TaxID=188477 RepID=A0A3S0Z7Y7_ELYCH|nr:hypothetical protein EGW08_019457 [Elysia chlorotica]